MRFEPYHLYHVYNQGNNREPIFFHRDNYLYFLQKVKKHVAPFCEIMAWCLMPNHFHFLVGTSLKSVEPIKVGNLILSQLSNGIRILEGSYSQGINQQNNRTGSLFRKSAKSKCLTEEAFNYEEDSDSLAPDFLNLYPVVCFNYIHQNPVQSNLVATPQDWEFSSMRDFLGLRKGQLCNQALCHRWIGVKKEDFHESYQSPLNRELIKKNF